MKRHRVILTTVLLVAVLGVVLPRWRELWLVVAYEQHSNHPGSAYVGWKTKRYEKRYSWIPGPTHVMPPQVCGYCRNESHSVCSDVMVDGGYRLAFSMSGVRSGFYLRHVKSFDGQWQEVVGWNCTCECVSHGAGR